MERSVKKNTFDASAIVPGCSAETRSTSRTLLQIGREADLLFKAVDVLGIVPNQPASIAQATNEIVCSCRNGTHSDPTHLGDVLVEEMSAFRIREDRRIEKTPMAPGIRAVFRSKVLISVRDMREKRL
jgi:hypothetical protein